MTAKTSFITQAPIVLKNSILGKGCVYICDFCVKSFDVLKLPSLQGHCDNYLEIIKIVVFIPPQAAKVSTAYNFEALMTAKTSFITQAPIVLKNSILGKGCVYICDFCVKSFNVLK